MLGHRVRALLLLLVGGWLMDVATAQLVCPPRCACYIGTLRCIRSHLNAIPAGLPRDTTMIDLRFNHFVELPRAAFAGLTQLTTLFLSDDDIERLPADALRGASALRQLYLNNNRIRQLPAGLFAHTPKLQTLYLDHNELAAIEDDTFRSLPQLTRLLLNNNNLRQLPGGAFTTLSHLAKLRLDGNPVLCDCGIYTLWRWHLNKAGSSQRLVVSLACAAPTEWSGRGLTAFREEDFHCRKPEVMQAPHDMQLASGDVAVLSCAMEGDPQPEIVWLHDTNEIGGSQSAASAAASSHMRILETGSLRIDPVGADDVGIYECIGRNEAGKTHAPPVRLLVEEPPGRNEIWPEQPHTHNTQRPALAGSAYLSPPRLVLTPADQTVALNANAALLECAADGHPRPEIVWYFNGRPIGQSTPMQRLLANGSLVLVHPTVEAAGTYRCEASNAVGRDEANARIDVKELPEIFLAPQNQTIPAGQPFVLECDAAGNPLPTIAWLLNGAPIVTSSQVVLENENTELTVKAARDTDAGTYTCIAANENGRSLVAAMVRVEAAQNAPRLLIEPIDLAAITGTSIELPCKTDGDADGVQISWAKDGRSVDPNVAPFNRRFEISGAGSLLVKNITLLDGGRYECSVRNQYGRTAASAVVTVKNNIDLAPGDRYVRIAFAQAATEIDLAINNTIDMLFGRKDSNNNAPTQNTNNAGQGQGGNPGNATRPPQYGELLRVFRFPTGEARQLARATEIYERTLVNIRRHVREGGSNLTVPSERYEFRDLLSRDHLHLVAELSGCMAHREMPNCTDMCYHSRYRSIDGTCNNLQRPTWGASLTAFRRLAAPIYEDGFSQPVGWQRGRPYAGGHPLPSARLVSTALVATRDITPDERITHMVMQWGQFLDHDLDHAIPSVSSESWDGIDCKKTCTLAPPCYPIEVPPGDPRVKNRRCIDVVRSSAICGSDATSVFFGGVQHREQINQLTAWIDGSQVYGYSGAFAQELRNLSTDEGLLRVGVHFPRQRDMLPFAAPQDGMDCRRNLDENQMSCFVAGDIRVNEQVGLLAMHTVWMREHNRVARALRDINPHWDGDTLYQEARKIVGAQMQHITYTQWLPLIVGPSGMELLGPYGGYNPALEPAIANEFATAALRFGHTLINPILQRLDGDFQPIAEGHLPLHKAFFAPWRLAYEGGVDPLMRGMYAVPAKLKTPTQNLNLELTEKLFYTAHAVALDLAAINIQRGRDHGLPGYNVYRGICNMSVARTFEDLRGEIADAGVRQRLAELYGHPDNIDVWLGGILEEPVAGGKVGPLFQCLLLDQFRRLRDGDRHFYEKPGVFLPQQLEQIRQASLGRVLCDVGDRIDRVTDNVFVLPDRQAGGLRQCEDVAGINLYLWQDCGTCSSLPPLFATYIPQTYERSNGGGGGGGGGRQRRALRAQDEAEAEAAEANALQAMAVDEERLSGLEEVIGAFHKDLKKLHKKLRQLEQSCGAASNNTAAAPTAAVATAAATTDVEQAFRGGKMKPKRGHCVDDGGTTRINNEIWSPDVCTQCACHHAQISCTREVCPAPLVCPGEAMPTYAADACCPHCAINAAQ